MIIIDYSSCAIFIVIIFALGMLCGLLMGGARK